MFRYLIFVCLLSIFTFVPFRLPGQKLTLDQAIEEMKTSNPEIMKMRQELKATKSDFWHGISPDDPKLFAEFEGIPKSRHSLSDYGEKKIGVVQEIEFPLSYVFMGTWHRTHIDKKKAAYQGLENDLISQVKKKFSQLLLLKDQMELYAEITALTQELYRKAKIRVDAGDAPLYDALKVKVDLAEVENRVVAIQREMEIARNDLALLLGRKDSDTLEIEGKLSFSPINLNLDSLKRIAQENYPFLRETQELVSLHRTERNLTWVGLLPNFELRYFEHQLQDEPESKTWGAEIGLSIPLWFFMKDHGKIRSANYRLYAAKWNYELEKRKLSFKIEEGFSKLLLAEKQVQNYRDNVLKEVAELVRIATRSYEEGEMGYIEVAEALRTLNRAKAGYSEALYEFASAQAELERAVGVGLFNNH